MSFILYHWSPLTSVMDLFALERCFSSCQTILSLCLSDTPLTAVLWIFSMNYCYYFGSSNTTTDSAKPADFQQQNLKLCSVKFFFLFFANLVVNETSPHTEQDRQPYMAFLGVSIVLMINSHKHAPPHEQVIFIRLKQANLWQFVQLTEVGEMTWPVVRTNLTQHSKRGFMIRMQKCSRMRLIDSTIWEEKAESSYWYIHKMRSGN